MSRWDESIAKLVELTRSGVLAWEKGNPVVAPSYANNPKKYPMFDREDLWGLPYFTTFAGKIVALYECRVGNTDVDERFFWTYLPSVEFISSSGDLEFAWPVGADARDLLETVRYHASGAEDFLEKLLATKVRRPNVGDVFECTETSGHLRVKKPVKINGATVSVDTLINLTSKVGDVSGQWISDHLEDEIPDNWDIG